MGLILETEIDRPHLIRAHHVIGRKWDGVDTLLTQSSASRLHASFIWNGHEWRIDDLSSNGTWLRGKRIPPGSAQTLHVGDELQFGSPAEPIWRFVDGSPPKSLLVGLGENAQNIPLAPYVFLPNDLEPMKVVSFDERAAHWFYQDLSESDGDSEVVWFEHGDQIACGEKKWQLFLADSINKTDIAAVEVHAAEDIEFVFSMSLDEENTSLQVRDKKRDFNLGERSHHYLLLHLARKRAVEAMNGLDAKSQGWANKVQLAEELGVEPTHINILIFRAREQLACKLPTKVVSEQVFEKARGKVRFGIPSFRIFKGEQLVSQLPLPESI